MRGADHEKKMYSIPAAAPASTGEATRHYQKGRIKITRHQHKPGNRTTSDHDAAEVPNVGGGGGGGPSEY